MSEAPGPGREVRRRIRKLTRLGRPSDRTVMRAVRWLTAFAISIANLAGTAIVFVILVWVIPPDGDDGGSAVTQPDPRRRLRRCSRLPLGIAWAFRRLRPSRRWLREDRDPTPEEQRNLLRAPLTVFFVVGSALVARRGPLRRLQHDLLVRARPPRRHRDRPRRARDLPDRLSADRVAAAPGGRAGSGGAPARGPGPPGRDRPDPVHLGPRVGGADARPRYHRPLRARRRRPGARPARDRGARR